MENSEACKGYQVRSFRDCLRTLNLVKYVRLSLDKNSLQEEKVAKNFFHIDLLSNICRFLLKSLMLQEKLIIMLGPFLE